MKTRRKLGLTLLFILWMIPQTVFAFSSENDILTVGIPENAMVDETMIIGSVANNVTRQKITVMVSENASWGLYVDDGCINKIADDTMHLNVGKNTAYIKVTAQDGGIKLYTITIIRAGISSDSDSFTGFGHTSTVGSWQQEPTGWRYVKAGGGHLHSEWANINEQWYYFNAAGYMLTGWFLDVNDNGWYYLNPVKDENEGAMLIGWLSDPQDGNCYYLDPVSGRMAFGWLQIGDDWYYFNEKGPKPLGALGAKFE